MTCHTSLAFASLALLLASACGGTVDTTSAGSGSGGATTTSSGATSSAGTTVSTGTKMTTSSTGSGGAGGGPCVGSVDMQVDSGAVQHLTADCANTWNPTMSTHPEGYVFSGGPSPGIENLVLVGCVSAAPMSEGIVLSASNAMSPGTYTKGAPQYTDPGGVTWGVNGDSFKLTVDTFGAVGEPIAGGFFMVVTHGGNAAHTVKGNFHVCRVPDALAP